MIGDPPTLRMSVETAVGALLSEHVERNASGAVGDVLTVFEPARLSQRMAAQQGAFLWPGRVDKTILEILGTMGDLKDAAWEIVIPTTERGRAIDQLRLMNITRASLFPGLDGYASSFRYLAVGESRLNDDQFALH